jgi:hypothetical protein
MLKNGFLVCLFNWGERGDLVGWSECSLVGASARCWADYPSPASFLAVFRLDGLVYFRGILKLILVFQGPS